MSLRNAGALPHNVVASVEHNHVTKPLARMGFLQKFKHLTSGTVVLHCLLSSSLQSLLRMSDLEIDEQNVWGPEPFSSSRATSSTLFP